MHFWLTQRANRPMLAQKLNARIRPCDEIKINPACVFATLYLATQANFKRISSCHIAHNTDIGQLRADSKLIKGILRLFF